MPFQITDRNDETIARIRAAIESAFPDAEVDIGGEGGRFELRVVSGKFSGKKTLDRQRMVYSAIGHLIKGMNAPVHAIAKLETLSS